MSILTIAQNVSDRAGFNRPSSIVGSADETARQLLQFINEETRCLSDRFPWQKLKKRATFNFVSSQENYTLPTDFKDFVQNTIWNYTARRPLIAPINAEQYEIQKNYLISSGIDKMVYLYGNQIYITPTPSSTDTINYEYTTLNIFENSGGTGKSAITLDTDTTTIREYLVELGVKLRYLCAKGLIRNPVEASPEYQDYEKQVVKAIEKDGFGQNVTISLNSGGSPYWMGAYTQDSDFPSV